VRRRGRKRGGLRPTENGPAHQSRPTARREGENSWAKGEEKSAGKLGFRPETAKEIISLFPFSFLTLQIHFQMIFEIISF
jgi:hypothetical protein